MTNKEKAEARAKYTWDDVTKDIALTTPLTVRNTALFSRAYMEHVGIHPYDLTELVYAFFNSSNDQAGNLQQLIIRTFRLGRESVDEP